MEQSPRSWLCEIRKNLGLRQADLARISGYSASYLCEIEKGVKTPSVHTAQRIALLLNFPWIKFFSDTDVNLLEEGRERDSCSI